MRARRRPLIYVAGPLRDPNPWVVEQNVRRAEACGRLVVDAGAVPVVVHTMYRTYQDMPESFWNEACMSLVSTCDALVVCVSREGSLRSAGTTDEVRQAVADSKTIFYDEVPSSVLEGRDVSHDQVRTIVESGRHGFNGLWGWIVDWVKIHEDLPG